MNSNANFHSIVICEGKNILLHHRRLGSGFFNYCMGSLLSDFPEGGGSNCKILALGG